MLSTQTGTVANQPRSVNDGTLVHTKISTPLGSMVAVADSAAVYLLEFENRVALTGELRRIEGDSRSIGFGSNTVLETLVAHLDDYFAGKSAAFQIPTFQRGTVLEEAVWQALKRIRPGQTRSYGDIAKIIGQPEKSRGGWTGEWC